MITIYWTVVLAKTVTIRTPPSSNGHRFSFTNCGKITVDENLSFEKLDSTSDNVKQIVLLGENQAGHERKVHFMGKSKLIKTGGKLFSEFAGEIKVTAERVHLQAESWMQKQMGQAKRFGEAKQDDKMAEQKGFRFY